MLRTLNCLIVFIGALALALLLGGCEKMPHSPAENATETNVIYVDENAVAVDENVAMDANASGNVDNATEQGSTDDGSAPLVLPATDTGPDDEAEAGLGAFKDLGDMEVNNWYTVEFYVAPDQGGLAEESEGIELTSPTAIYVAPAMRVTMAKDPNFEVNAKSDEIVMTGRDKAASWLWDVKPLTGGERTLYAIVEILQRNPDGSLKKNPDGSYVSSEPKKRRVDVKVKVGTWRGFMTALQNASSLGDVLGTLFGAWEKALLALALLIGAAGGVWLAIKNWGKPKEEGRIRARAGAAAGAWVPQLGDIRIRCPRIWCTQ